ncbi:hypothetical protein [Streptomyces sp. NRRL B-24085]|uniref:hypothetical protein n=1 Tax=Streptomyces sp. NRRL B-24085 TaxID=1709476 RepID=UPI00131B6E64|nr:hypothetical protein [Streptomyces sp. NRRL B-24085]
MRGEGPGARVDLDMERVRLLERGEGLGAASSRGQRHGLEEDSTGPGPRIAVRAGSGGQVLKESPHVRQLARPAAHPRP